MRVIPSVPVHVAVAGVVETALLGDRFDAKAIPLVPFVTASIDSDTLIELLVSGAHRTPFHNGWIVLVPAALLFWDGSRRESSTVRER